MTAARRWLRGLPLALLVAAAAVVPAGQAMAAGELELSDDGVTWAETLTGQLFGTPEAVVPGDVITSALWVRNASADPAQVRLDVADDLGVTPGTLAGDLSLSIDGDAVAGGDRWAGPVLAPGAAVRIPLVVTFAAESQSTTQLSTAAVLDAVLLVQTGVGSPPTTGPTAPTTAPGTPPTGPSTPTTGPGPTGVPAARPSGGLARTGQDVAAALLLGIAAVGSGGLLLAARRRARRGED